MQHSKGKYYHMIDKNLVVLTQNGLWNVLEYQFLHMTSLDNAETD